MYEQLSELLKMYMLAGAIIVGIITVVFAVLYNNLSRAMDKFSNSNDALSKTMAKGFEKLEARINEMETKLEARIAGVETKPEARIVGV
ncbi:MAG: hypothetical protein LBR80_18715 [Deltaproteobacteria bacterium]|jgi:hypothetical protein|nr:hypothetical protein [Deltaproteobacteria bacterium]